MTSEWQLAYDGFEARCLTNERSAKENMWRDALEKLSDDLTFSPSATEEEIGQVEKALGLRLPEQLRSLLSESNGIEGEYGLGLLWETARIKDDNLKFRTSEDFTDLYMPFEPLLFFGDAGNGDQFAFTILGGRITCDDIFAWSHGDDSRTWVAPSLKVFYDWWLSGKITL